MKEVTYLIFLQIWTKWCSHATHHKCWVNLYHFNFERIHSFSYRTILQPNNSRPYPSIPNYWNDPFTFNIYTYKSNILVKYSGHAVAKVISKSLTTGVENNTISIQKFFILLCFIGLVIIYIDNNVIYTYCILDFSIYTFVPNTPRLWL